LRSAVEIKKEILRLRFTNRMPLAQIAKDSGCQVKQVVQAMQLDASELVLRRLDAYLDAPKLHKVSKETVLLERLAHATRELGRWQLRTIPMRDVQLLSTDKQKRLYRAMQWRLKKALREHVKAIKGWEPRFADSASYHKCLAEMASKHGIVAPERVFHGRDGAGPVVQAGGVHPRGDQGR
jgi:hypothetical protein